MTFIFPQAIFFPAISMEQTRYQVALRHQHATNDRAKTTFLMAIKLSPFPPTPSREIASNKGKRKNKLENMSRFKFKHWVTLSGKIFVCVYVMMQLSVCCTTYNLNFKSIKENQTYFYGGPLCQDPFILYDNNFIALTGNRNIQRNNSHFIAPINI